MPKQYASSIDSLRRLLWWLIAGLLLFAAASGVASWLLAAKIESWLGQRGLESEIDHLRISIPDLRLVARGVRAKNAQGRGFSARELMLDYSWWQLLRGRLRLQRAYLEGAYMDLESSAGARGRRWEVGGWALGQGPRRDRDFELLLDWVRIRDSTLCYRHRPAWPTPSCAGFDELRLRDFLLGLQRSGDEPLDITIGAQTLGLRNLLIQEKASGAVDTALVKLDLSGGLYRRRPGNRISADTVAARMFGSCPQRRWAEALPALRRLIGHCGVARRLQLKGDLLFSFGRGAEVRWQRASGRGITLRYADHRWPNWRAQSLSLSDFRYIREQKKLGWRSAEAGAFYWCPPGLRGGNQHYCARAGRVQLPDPVTFDWRSGLRVAAGPSRLQQLQLLDLAGDIRNPLTAQRALLGALEYDGKSRSLQFGSVDLESAGGCIPGQLWRQPDYCLLLAGLRGAEPLRLRFPSRARDLPWGFASGPLALAQFRLERDGARQLQLQKLRWARIDSIGDAGAPLSLQDFAVGSLSGCVPEGLLPQGWQPLCADLSGLDGRGNFAWRGGADGYLIAGELRLQRLLLAEGLNGDRGLLLQQLHTGQGYMRRDADGDNPWIDSDPDSAVVTPVTAAPAVTGGSDAGEKGQLPQERARRGGASAQASQMPPPPSAASPNLQLQSSALERLQGCLPPGWARLLYRGRAQMPECFELRDLRQRGPLALAWQGGLDFAARELSLERAQVTTAAGKSLLDLSGLRMPDARLRHLPPPYRSTLVSLPELSLQAFSACLPQDVAPPAPGIRCAELSDLQLGGDFRLTLDSRRLSAQLDGSRAQRILLAAGGERLLLDLQKLSAPQLRVQWPRGAKRPAQLALRDLSAERLLACLPQTIELRAGLPRCVSIDGLHSLGDGGLALGETLFKAAPAAEPLWRAEGLRVARLSLAPDTLDLHGLQIRALRVCGLRQLLPNNARAAGVADCVSARQLDLAGSSRIGLTPAAARVEVGELRSQPISLWQEVGEYARAGVKRLSWRRLRWDGGRVLWISDLLVQGFTGCTAGPVGRIAVDVIDLATSGRVGSCFRLRELRLPGRQRISLAAPVSTDGSIVLLGLSVARAGGEPLHIARIQLDQLAYGGTPIGTLSGASGCLPAGLLGDNRLAPCYRFGRVEMQRMERVDTPTGRATLLHGFSIDGVELTQPDYPAGLPAQLLHLKNIRAERLRLGGGGIDAQRLQLDGIAGCVPPGYVARLNHCLTLENISASGSYSAAGRQLALAQLQLHKIQLLSGDGRSLVRGARIEVEQLRAGGAQWHFLSAEATDFEMFDRREGAPEYDRHSVIGRLAEMRVEQFRYDSAGERLEIGRVDALRPRLILLRDRAGEYPALREIAALTGAPAAEKPLVRAADAVTEGVKFRYHIRELDVRHGTFTWVDRQGRYRARLPIRAIYLTVRNISNLPQHPPSVVLLNGRPGGFGEIQLAGTIDYLNTRQWNADLTGYIVDSNLIPATPYMAKLLGYKILQGQLDARLDIQIRENKVEAFADMGLEKIRVRRVREDDQLDVEPSFIPLNIALWLLKDGRGDVHFGMPISGDLYDPTFSFSFIFSDLLQKAILEALFSYFTPVGFYTLGKYAWGRFRAVSFDPIVFQPGSAELDAGALEQLREMVVTLQERPDARPGICGIANARDWHALYPNSTPGLGGSRKARESFYRHPPLMLFEEFERLALERSRQIERFLIDAGITAHELIPCAPDYNGRDFGEPRVEFSN